MEQLLAFRVSDEMDDHLWWVMGLDFFLALWALTRGDPIFGPACHDVRGVLVNEMVSRWSP